MAKIILVTTLLLCQLISIDCIGQSIRMDLIIDSLCCRNPFSVDDNYYMIRSSQLSISTSNKPQCAIFVECLDKKDFLKKLKKVKSQKWFISVNLDSTIGEDKMIVRVMVFGVNYRNYKKFDVLYQGSTYSMLLRKSLDGRDWIVEKVLYRPRRSIH